MAVHQTEQSFASVELQKGLVAAAAVGEDGSAQNCQSSAVVVRQRGLVAAVASAEDSGQSWQSFAAEEFQKGLVVVVVVVAAAVVDAGGFGQSWQSSVAVELQTDRFVGWVGNQSWQNSAASVGPEQKDR